MRQQGGRRGGGGGGGEGETREHIHSNTTGNFSPTDNLKMGQKVNRDTRQGQCHEIFDTFFLSKNSTWAVHLNRQKWFREIFSFSQKIFAKNVCPRRQRLCRQGDGVVNDYADTDKTTRTLSKNLEGFSQILKEQSGEKGTGVFTNTI